MRKSGIQDVNFQVLIKWSSEVNSKAFLDFIRETGLINRMYNSVPHSGAGGGGNATIMLVGTWQPPLKTKKKKIKPANYEEESFVFCLVVIRCRY